MHIPPRQLVPMTLTDFTTLYSVAWSAIHHVPVLVLLIRRSVSVLASPAKQRLIPAAEPSFLLLLPIPVLAITRQSAVKRTSAVTPPDAAPALSLLIPKAKDFI